MAIPDTQCFVVRCSDNLLIKTAELTAIYGLVMSLDFLHLYLSDSQTLTDIATLRQTDLF
jgi:hypothetical protein